MPHLQVFKSKEGVGVRRGVMGGGQRETDAEDSEGGRNRGGDKEIEIEEEEGACWRKKNYAVWE